jgi:hypothetical protein
VRISSDIRILCTIGNELKKTTTHVCLYSQRINSTSASAQQSVP